MRPLLVGAIVLLGVSMNPTLPRAQMPPLGERVWTGAWEERYFAERNFGFTRTQIRVTFTLTEGRDVAGSPMWTSRAVQWSYRSESADFDSVAVEETAPDQRGFMLRRVRQDTQTTCAGSGSVELGPGLITDTMLIPTAAQAAQLRPSCVTEARNRETGDTTRTTSMGDPVGFPGIPSDYQIQGCRYNESWRTDLSRSYYEGSFNVTRSSAVEAVMEVDPAPGAAYGRFVPVPGETLTFIATVRSGKARFRFELDPEGTSHFPGYATNANVDDVFFARHGVTHLQREYANDGPDFLFDAAAFDRQEWSRIEPLVVETSEARESAAVTITAMDYGAVGRLRAFVQPEGCGGSWQPVTVRLGQTTRDFVDLPLDEDENLIADALEEYRSLGSDADDDAEPESGTAGDGLTAFEEYRGLLVRGIGCGNEPVRAQYSESQLANAEQVAGWSDEHLRTHPARKDLFVHTPDPELALVVPAFAAATGLEVHLICEPHYGDNETRVVNFTLHRAALRAWQNHPLIHEEPQHGIFLEPVGPFGLRGLAVPVANGYIGPPKLTQAVKVTKPGVGIRCVACLLEYSELIHTTVHELGHAVGIPHHGDRIETATWRLIPGRQNITEGLSLLQHAGGPPDFGQPDSLPAAPGDYYAAIEGRTYLASLLVEPGEGCIEGADDAVYYKEGRFAGCAATSIARRGQQNSGHFECPMRYSGSHYYEAPGTVAQFRWTDRVSQKVFSRWRSGFLVDAWGGRLLKYRNELDRDGTGPMCAQIRGTGINALPGEMNHSGDAGRDKGCRDYIVINDSAAPGIP